MSSNAHLRTALILPVALAIGLTGCGSPPDDATDGPDGTSVAFTKDFTGFRAWPSFRTAEENTASATVHGAGPRTIYINRIPAAGAKEFSPGTIIVKVMDGLDGKIFAMGKRGGNYNTTGAVGWEWFEIKEQEEGYNTMLWRGVGPPVGEMYGGDPTTGCNGCHVAARNNDFVLSPRLNLSAIEGLRAAPSGN